MAARATYYSKPSNKQLENYLVKNQMSMAELAKKANVSHGTIWGILHGYHTPRPDIYQRILDIITK